MKKIGSLLIIVITAPLVLFILGVGWAVERAVDLVSNAYKAWGWR